MKTRISALCLLHLAFCLHSCSSNSEQKTEDKSTASEKTMSIDTSLHGLVGVIEKNPPVQYGDYVSKYPNGVIKLKGFYVNGKRNGEWMSFFENGKIQSDGFFKDGLRDGKALVYFPNGQIYYEGYYDNGKEIGKWIFFDDKGTKINEKDFGSKPNS